MVNEIASKGDHLILFLTSVWLPIMFSVFLIASAMRGIIYFKVYCQLRFAKEFEKRVHKYLADPGRSEGVGSFHQVAKTLLEQTYYETFDLKHRNGRRKFDGVSSTMDHFFQMPKGVTRLIQDTLHQAAALRKGGRQPRFLDISKLVFNANPVFNFVFSRIPMGICHELIDILPGLIVMAGGIGTFVYIMEALPLLRQMDGTVVEVAKRALTTFNLKLVVSLEFTIIGVALAGIIIVLNTVLSPETNYLNLVDKYTNSLEFLWDETLTNEVFIRVESRPDRRAVVFTNQAVKGGAALDAVSTPEFVASLTQEGKPQDSPKAPTEPPAQLKQRLSELDAEIRRAYVDKNKGAISEEMWREKFKRWQKQREKILADLAQAPRENKPEAA